MQCPDCDLSVLVQDGTITPHLRPDTLKRCDAKPSKAEAPPKTPDEAATAPAAKQHTATKAPTRPTSKPKPSKS